MLLRVVAELFTDRVSSILVGTRKVNIESVFSIVFPTLIPILLVEFMIVLHQQDELKSLFEVSSTFFKFFAKLIDIKFWQSSLEFGLNYSINQKFCLNI